MNTIKKYINVKALYNLPYVLWLVFYYVMFSLLFGGTGESFLFFGAIYIVSIVLSLTVGESFFRLRMGLRKVRTRKEKDRLIPIFNQVYRSAKLTHPSISKHIKLYIDNSMEINAYAFGKSTLAVTKGSILLLDDRALYGLIAHEMGHFAHCDTHALIMASVGNSTLRFFTMFFNFSFNVMDRIASNEDRSFIIRVLRGILMFVYKIILFVGDLFLLPVSRQGEYRADKFAFECGYGAELHHALSTFEMLESTPIKLVDRVFSTHPSTPNRLARLEQLLDS